ncbi:uncharacterized protein LOC128220649 [Mya arenaria]|uniref:uncharacterized protein LOC128220649 n=1 Tax=Mya arenaria TaxID=6604 RepID=UPI0022E2F3AD|nr:uncharacterized protein LOC128220649 [Mya arenaria]
MELLVKRNTLFRGCLVLFGGFLVHLAIGALYTFGNFSPYFVSYLRNRTADSSVQNVDALWVNGIGAFGNLFGMLIAGVVNNMVGPRLTTLLGTFVYCGTVAASYFSVNSSLIILVVTYGFVCNLGNKIIYPVPVSCAIKWFPTRPSLVSGIILAGYGGGATIFNQVITAYINPDNYSPDLVTEDGERYFTQPDLLDRVPFCFLVLAGSYFGMQIIGTLLISDPPSQDIKDVDISFPKEIDIPVKENGHGLTISTVELMDTKKDTSELSNGAKTAHDDLSIPAVLKVAFTTRSYYVVIISVFFLTCGTTIVFSMYKAYGQTFIHDDHFLALVGSMSSVFNSLGRPAWGIFNDKYGYRVSLWGISGGLTVLFGTLQLTEHMSKELYLVWVCGIFAFLCGLWAVIPSTLSRLFGVKHLAATYGFVTLGLAFSSLLASILGTRLKESLGWTGIFYIATGTSAFTFLLTILFNGVDSKRVRI